VSTPDQPTDPYRPQEPAVPQYGQYAPQDPAAQQYGYYAPQDPAVPQQPAAATYGQYDQHGQFGDPQPLALQHGQPAGGYSAYPTDGAYAAYPVQQQYGMPMHYPKNNLAVWSLVLGIAGFILCGLLVGIPAVITGLSARKAVAHGEANNGGMAIAGIVLGSVAIVWSAFAFLVVVVSFIAGAGSASY